MHNPAFGIFLKVASAFVLVAMIAIVKAMSATYPTGQLIFARAFFGMVPVFVWITLQGQLGTALKTKAPMKHISRGIVGTMAMGLWFAALGFLPLPDATAIGYAAPLFTTALAAIMLGEVVRVYRWSAVVVGFLGVLIVLYPHIGAGADQLDRDTQIGSLLALGAAVFMALAVIHVRSMTATETTASIVLYFAATASVAGLATLPFGWVMPDLKGVLLLVTIGLMGGFGQILLTMSYRYAEASIIAPFDYTTMIWTVLIGILFFDEIPSIYVIVGATIVIAAGIFVIWRERRLGIDRAEQAKAVTPMRT